MQVAWYEGIWIEIDLNLNPNVITYSYDFKQIAKSQIAQSLMFLVCKLGTVMPIMRVIY